jgi:UDP-glucose 4-epimerase
MNVLVTGGAGYIGSVTVAELLGAGHKVVVYDNLSKGHREALSGDVELIVGDIADTEKLQSTLKTRRIDAVLHFAALIEAGESMSVPERYFRNNTFGTLALLEAMLAAGVSRLVFSSTAAVYGQPENTPILESDALRPTNAYGESKLLVERMLRWFQESHGFRYASLRYFNAAGATTDLGEAHDPESHLIPLTLAVAQGTRPFISIYGTDYPTPDGTCVRDYIHVVDLAHAHVLALSALEQRAQMIYNLGNGHGFSVRQVVDAARRITGLEIAVKETARRPGDPAILVASSARIREELGWTPRYPDLDTIVSTAWEWHRKHPRAYAAERSQQYTAT